MDPEKKQTLIARLESPEEEDRRQAMVELRGELSEDDLEWLTGPLSDESWRVRKEAIEGLSGLGPHVELISRLIPLMDPTREVTLRNSVVEILERMGSGVAPHIAEHLDVEQADIRKFLVDILGNIADPRVIPRLVNLLHDPENNIRAAAAESLASIGDPECTPALIEALDRADNWVTFSVLSALARIGDRQALPVFFRYLDDRILANPAIEGIGRKGEIGDGVRLMEMLPHLPRGASKSVFVAVGMIFRRAVEAGYDELEDLKGLVVKAVNDQTAGYLCDQLAVSDNHDERRNYLAVLGLIGGERSLQSILSLIDDETLEWDVNLALLEIGRKDPGAVIPLLENHDELVRRKAVQVIQQLGVSGLLDKVYPMLQDESGNVRKEAARAVAVLGDSGSIQPLFELLSDEYRDVAEAAAESIAGLGRRDPEVFTEKIQTQLPSSSAEVRALLIRILSEVDAQANLPTFVNALLDPESGIRAAALSSIKRTGDMTAASSVINSLADESPEVRVEAAMALEEMQPPEALEPLKAVLFDQDAWVRSAAVSALAAQPNMRPADLMPLLSGDDLMIKTSVIEALGRRGARGFEDAVDILEQLFRDETVEIKRSICRAAAQIKGDQSFDLLLEAVQDADPGVRTFAAQGLALKEDEASIAVLRGLARDDPDRVVRDTARSLLDSRA